MYACITQINYALSLRSPLLLFVTVEQSHIDWTNNHGSEWPDKKRNKRCEKSSVVSVLISLISDMWVNDPHDIKLISLGGGFATVACYWGSQVSLKRCTIAGAWRTPLNLV
ncbi:hypothetical protein PRUPE_1G136200 [Prunus persica]|uniref:Uncharacterized protein n=1 Tax=Prunus persica TaxID=3760 RepID=M5XNU9_PRUPE|nr:hypothetical protein PRUPE_1G136200 [Prunus persica]